MLDNCFANVYRSFDYAQDDRDSMNLKPSNILTSIDNNFHIPVSSLFHQRERFATGRFMHKYTVDESRKMLMGCVIVVGNKVANLKSGQITLKR